MAVTLNSAAVIDLAIQNSRNKAKSPVSRVIQVNVTDKGQIINTGLYTYSTISSATLSARVNKKLRLNDKKLYYTTLEGCLVH